MSNRSWPYVVVTAPANNNRDESLQETVEIKATNASRAGNKARKARADAEGVKPTAIQVLDAYRDLPPIKGE